MRRRRHGVSLCFECLVDKQHNSNIVSGLCWMWGAILDCFSIINYTISIEHDFLVAVLSIELNCLNEIYWYHGWQMYFRISLQFSCFFFCLVNIARWDYSFFLGGLRKISKCHFPEYYLGMACSGFRKACFAIINQIKPGFLPGIQYEPRGCSQNNVMRPCNVRSEISEQ